MCSDVPELNFKKSLNKSNMDFPNHTLERMSSPRVIKDVWEDIREFWKRPTVREYRLEGFVLLTGLLLGTLLVLGSLRQRTARSEIKFCLRAAFYLSGHALSYVMGALTNDSPVENALVIVWAVILLVLYSTADNVGSESLGDNEARRKRFLWDYMIPYIWFLGLLLFKVPPQRFWIPLLLLVLLFLLKLRERKLALMCACRSRVGLDRVTRVVAEYMKYEHTLSGVGDEDATTMHGYKYLVGMKEAVEAVALKKPPRHDDHLDVDRIVTLEKIWKSEGWLFDSRGDPDGYLKDTCLSFALFWLLLRRFADYDLAELSTEESRSKTWNFVRDGLIKDSRDEEEACERAFRVVEVELDFLYDYFYNNYYAVYSRGGTRYLLVRLGVLGLYFVMAFITVRKFTPEERESRPWYDTNNVQIIVTKAVIYALIAIELAQISIIATSKWVKVKWVCNYIQNRWWWQKRQGKCAEWLLYMLCRAPCMRAWCKPWQKKLHQYSLLDSYGHTPKVSRLKCIFDGYIDLPTDGQKENKPERLTVDVMKAVIESLRTNGQNLSNGMASLERNQVKDNLLWACMSYETNTHVILIWHIATSICEMPLSSSSSLKDAAVNFHVATSLSKYCAYLVALAPKLLPDHVYVAQCLFEQVVCEARETLENCNSRETVYDKLISVSEEIDHGGSILKQGALLGKHLMNIEGASLRWKVLAEFWAEFIVFLAPSKDPAVHAEYLVSGGEFITHLWVLLTHAGIVDRKDYCGRVLFSSTS